MLSYHIRTAAKSLRRNPVLSSIIVGGIALGICASTTFTTARHMMGRDPLPGRSDRIYYVRLDSWDATRPYDDDGTNPRHLPPQVTYRDAMELLKSPIPLRKSIQFRTTFIVYPDPKQSRPFNAQGRACNSDFFPMFGVPFAYGGPWDRRAEAKGEQVVVLDHNTNETLFGGRNSVGQRVRLNDRDFTVVGVLAPWRPNVRYYDMLSNPLGPPEALFVPYTLLTTLQLRAAGNKDNWKPLPPNATFDQLLASERIFMQFWVELRSSADLAAYNRYLDDYARSQKQLGRFPRPLNNAATPMMELMKQWRVISPRLTAMATMSVLFLVICALNLTGLLLGKFLARAPEISVRRALGATRSAIFLQHIVECELVGVVGGTIGILLSLGALAFISKFIGATTHIGLDFEMVMTAVFLSLVAGLIAGLYPAWRICSLQPAMQLKR